MKRGELGLGFALLLCLLLAVKQACPIKLTSQTVQLKTGNMLGSVGISMAQWDLEFDEDLYYFEAPPCAPGLTRQDLTDAAVAADPCWAGCDFTSPDPKLCGQPFNTTDPACQAICDQHPKKATLCDYTNRPWTVIEPNAESQLYTVTIDETLHIRFNWLLTEQGFRYDGMPAVGPVLFYGIALMDDAAELDGGTYCFTRNSPAAYTNVCPSGQCFHYGTWEVVVVIAAQGAVTDYAGNSSHILRTFPQVDGTTRRSEPRSDSPATYDVQYSALHTPLRFGVPVDVVFGATDTSVFYQLTTAYCGLINIQHEKAQWDRPTARVAIGMSTEGIPYPVSLMRDILFIDQALKPVWICPRPPETTSTVFFGVLRYAGSTEPTLSTPEMHYLTVDYYRPESEWKKYRLGANASDSGFSNYTNFPPLANWAPGLASNLFRLSCPTTLNSTYFETIACRSGSSTYGTCIEFLFGVPAIPWTVSLMPVPQAVRDINPEGFGNIQYPPFLPTAAKRLSAFLILELTSDGSVVSQTLGADWENLWEECVLGIGTDTPIASVDGDWFFADLVLNQTVPECVYSEFEDLAALMSLGIDLMANQPITAYSSRVIIDELTFHDPWQACTTFISSQLSTTKTSNVSIFASTACLDPIADDPCCNNDLSWTECCAPRDLVAFVDSLALDATAMNNTCRHPSCVKPLLEEYYRAELTGAVGGCTGPNLNTRLRAPLRVYRDCREAAFGDDFLLPSCVTDSDCASFGNSSTSYCNQVTRQCVVDFPESTSYFFECIADNLPIEARIKLIALNGFVVTPAHSLAEQLQVRYGRATKCLDDSFGSPWSLYNEYMETGSRFGGCPVCQQLATDVSYQPPPWCEIRSGSKCSYLWSIEPSTVGCDTPVCNWDQSDACNTKLLGTFFCGVCESDAICSQVSETSNKTSCDEIPSVCFLANGTVRIDLTEAECARTYSCTLGCSDGECKQNECEDFGYCEPDDAIYEAMAASSWNTVTPTGFCAVPMRSFNSPDCTDVHVGSLPTSYGCVVFADCIGLAALLNCTPNYYTEALCTTLLPDATWWPRYDNVSCLSARACNEQLVGIESLSSLGSRLRSPKSDSECSLCGGKMEELSTWVGGRWLPGTARTPQWVERQLVNRYKLAESIGFNTLYDHIYLSSRAAVAFQLQNNIQCSYQTMNTLISKISCACTTDLDREECFPGNYITNVGQGEACPLTSNTIVAPPAKLSYAQNSVSSELQNQCVEFSIDRINSRYFYGEAPPPITTGFVPTFSVCGWNSVVNKHGALVGQVVGDGIQIRFTQNGEYLMNLRVCLLISSNIQVSHKQPFTLHGLGYWTGSKDPATVTPYQQLANVSVENGYVCATVQRDQCREDTTFVPIYYRSDWEDQPSARFSSGQLALLYTVATLYMILCFIVVFQMIRLIGVGAWNFTVATNYIWILLFFVTIIRGIYIYLVAANVLGQQNTHLLVDFWMMDLPTLLYLISNTVIATAFLFTLLGSKHHTFKKRTFWITLLMVVAFIVTIFVAALLAFNFAVVKTQGSHGPVLCSTFTDNSSKATTIRIVYESLLFTIALLTALIAAAVAGRLWWDLHVQGSKSSLLALGIVSSFGILSDSLAYLIYYIVNNPTPYFAIVLIFTEIFPSTFLVLRVASRQINQTQQVSWNNNRTPKLSLDPDPDPDSGRGHTYSAKIHM